MHRSLLALNQTFTDRPGPSTAQTLLRACASPSVELSKHAYGAAGRVRDPEGVVSAGPSRSPQSWDRRAAIRALPDIPRRLVLCASGAVSASCKASHPQGRRGTPAWLISGSAQGRPLQHRVPPDPGPQQARPVKRERSRSDGGFPPQSSVNRLGRCNAKCVGQQCLCAFSNRQ